MRKINRIALIGLGAMGVFFAPRLWETYGENFNVIAGGERKARLENDGVTVNGKNYKFPVTTPEKNPDEEPFDLIIIGVKSYSLDQAIEDIRYKIGENTLIMSLLNGVDSEEKLIAAYGEEHVLHAFMRMSIVMKDGVADFDPYWGNVHFGEKLNPKADDVKAGISEYSDRVKAVKEVFDKADIPYIIEEDMPKGIWYKYMCNIGENMTCALLGIPFGGFHVSEHANWIRINAMREVMEIARKKGINITEEDIDRQNKVIPTIPYPNKPSTLQDLEGKKHTEIELFSGNVVKMGKELGVPTPISEMFYHGIRVHEEKNDGVI